MNTYEKNKEKAYSWYGTSIYMHLIFMICLIN